MLGSYTGGLSDDDDDDDDDDGGDDESHLGDAEGCGREARPR